MSGEENLSMAVCKLVASQSFTMHDLIQSNPVSHQKAQKNGNIMRLATKGCRYRYLKI